MEKILYKGKELFSPKLDLVFKALFGKEDSKELLRSFLNSVLNLNIQSSDDIKLTNTEIVSDTVDNKLSRLDICAKIKNVGDDEHIDIEIQLTQKDNMMKRSVYYVSKLFAEQLKKGDTYEDLGRAIGLSILDFNLFEDDKWMHRGRLKDIENNEEFTNCFEVNFIEMKKLTNISQADDEKLQWLMFLNAKTEVELESLVQQNTNIKVAVDRLEKISGDKNMQYEILMREKAERDYDSGIAFARNQGIQQGIQKGMQQGVQQGIQQGILETAKSLKTTKLSITEIAQVTGLSEETIRSL